ncbi:hypothetical protein FNV43_RR12842 [Rhamnella rubrinervis]|uniref:peptidyl-tRNA hydrolase n=1 Tax=Rhamnella rubrinervis TaxID=2594499 RepID=A0A8K0H8F7_9ROSA|nr:hypothetical protein FNV43_RR12842 [Rhamnella rubrinervis]
MVSLAAPFRCISFQFHLTLSCTAIRSTPSATSIRAPALSRLSSNSMSQLVSASAADLTPVPSQNDASEAESSDVLIQYVVLRRDLIDSWPLGSVVTQGCHASVSAIWSHREDPDTTQYCSPEKIDSMRKVTLEVKGEPQILNLSEKLTTGGVAHKLWIEQPENIPTCLATKPYPKSTISTYFKKLKLCNKSLSAVNL